MRKYLLPATLAALALVAGSVAAVSPAAAASLTSADFIKASGNVLKTGSGSGGTVNLRGTNVGGWLTQEDWMSPLGEFATDRTGWSVSASTGSGFEAIDGSGSSEWTTASGKRNPDWLLLDLGAPTRFNRLTLDSSSASQYPHALRVETSSDATTWRNVAEQPGTSGRTTVKFVQQDARYLRLTQTASDGAVWSVGELNLFFDAVLANRPFTATASSASSSAPRGVDGDLSTTWQSGTPQSPGQSFTVDFGRTVEMDRVFLDSGAAAANDYPRQWEMATSDDNVNFTPIASGYGTNRIVEADFKAWKYGRYLKITSNGTAAQWWTIADLSIAAGSNLDRNGWSVTASAGNDIKNTVDGNPATRWSTGVAQKPGQSIQIDLGSLQTLNNLSIDTAKNTTDEGDWARGYRLDLSRDGSNWKSVATGAGDVKVTTIGFPAQATRYLRLTQTGSALQWWSIGELTAGLYSDDYSLNNTLTSRFGTAGAQKVIDAHQDAWITESDLDAIAATGLNFIRVPMGWNTFLNLDGTWKADPWKKVDWITQEASERGMYVLLDLHTVPGGGCPWGSCGRIGPAPNGFWGNATYQDWVEDIWTAIANRYRGNPAVAGYDLINEPLIDGYEDADDLKKKNDYFDRLYDAVRAVDPDHLIVLAAFLGMDSIADPGTYGWTNVMYQLHPYDMSSPRDWNAQNRLVENELAAAPSRLADPGVPLLNGEYSLYYNDDLWAKWMAGMNASNISWSNWTYKVRGAAKDAFGYWGMYYDNQAPVPVINSDNPATFIAKLKQFTTDRFTKNTGFVQTVKKYAGGLSTFSPITISHSGWTATASTSANGTPPSAGIDGLNGSAWYSGRSQSGGEWYRIDMGSSKRLAMVTLETASASPEDYPRNFTIEVSTDGTNWRTAASGVGYGYKRPISIPPTTARFIRITQTGAATNWWSIDEVTAYSSY
ncbi:discoidin domain-containing protein [Rathayibacter sp. SD072]|uniref:discoidin domain-containing protein n=1 Tax=Rathayibacter sp. SD072 TaxID=2781731 RepID=UPI001A976114|nr:discoidin domain-containing protein [Rathayibacter sp. SD072]MBO0982638.1 discoidin domain-containing protein [Rathayibacter sp. SD072]